MRSEFDEWANEHFQSDDYFVTEIAQDAWNHQQARIDDLQKRVDAALKLVESWNEIAFDKTTHWTEGYEEGCYHCAASLEQALKGGVSQ